MSVLRRVMRWLPLTVLLLSACGGGPTTTRPSGPEQDPQAQARDLSSQGDYQGAARLYLALARQAPAPARDDYQLKAVAALLDAEQVTDAEQALQLVSPGGPFEARRTRLQARVALARHQPEQALQYLQNPPAANGPRDDAVQYYRMRAEAYAELGNYLESARERVDLDRYLDTPQQRLANQQALFHVLNNLTDTALDLLKDAPPPDVLSGWMDLVLLDKAARVPPSELETQLQQWHKLYPQHPALAAITDGMLERRRELIFQADRVALLLPLSGRFAKAAEAVRDGILAAYYRDKGHSRVQLKVYDLGENPAQVMLAYEQAVRDGAQFVIGPLSKEATQYLANYAELPVPTLVLNYADGDGPWNDKLYQLSLAPEDEARQVADRAHEDGLQQAALFLPQGSWGERLAQAFTGEWEGQGGTVVNTSYYDATKNDFSTPLQDMLNLQDSNARRSQLQKIIGQHVEFEPRRRQDLDMIFLGAFPRQARLIRPQIKFYHAPRVPVYATSNVFSGKPDPDHDRDMDGIVFVDMPATLEQHTEMEALRPYQGQLYRLVALGEDAYNLIPVLKRLRKYPDEHFAGATGSLTLDAQQRIHRHMEWARFSDGTPRLLPPPVTNAGN